MNFWKYSFLWFSFVTDEAISSGLKVVTVVASCFGLFFLVVIGLLDRSVMKHARTRALRGNSDMAHVHHKYMVRNTDLLNISFRLVSVLSHLDSH